MWLDDVIDIRTPIEVADLDTVETYYKEQNALFTLHIEDGKEVAATDELYELVGEENALSGDEIGRASCRERVWICGGAVAVEKRQSRRMVVLQAGLISRVVVVE